MMWYYGVMKLMLQRCRTLSTITTLGLITAFAAITVAFTPQDTALAQSVAAQPTDAELKQVREAAIISAAAQCISNGAWGGAALSERTLGEIVSYNWGQDTPHHVGHLVDPQDGYFGCQKEIPTAILNTLSTGLGVAETYCSLGAIPHSKEEQKNGYTCNGFVANGESARVLKILRDAEDKAVTWLQSKASKRTLSADSLIYVDALHLLQSRCKAEPRAGSADERANSNTRAVRIVASDGSVKEQWYYLPKPDDKFSLSAEARDIKCSDIANNVSQKSAAYAGVVQQKVSNAAAQTRERQVGAGASKFYDAICGGGPSHHVASCQKRVFDAWSECTTKQGSGPYTPGNTEVYTPTAEELLSCMNRKFPEKASAFTIDLAEASLAAAAAVEAVDPGVSTATPDDTNKKEGSSCEVEGGFGWVICPAITLMAQISDGAFSVISGFLKVNAKFLDSNSGTYTAWEYFRNFANAAFIIAFLAIIYSQVTGAGISSYGVKKMLPRLIIAAVLVNMSYFICQIMLDLTQILGTSLKGLLDGISANNKIPTWDTLTNDILGGTGITVGLAVAGGATVVIVALAISAPVLLATLLAVLMTVIILVGRQAAIVILTTVAPIAFVAYLLPNTESFFRRWIKMFWGLLLVYPIIAILYGGGALAGRIIIGAGLNDLFLSILAVGVSVIPLIMTPKLLQGALNATGELGAKLSGAAGKLNASLSGATKDSVKDSRIGKYMKYREHKRDLRKAAIKAGVYQPQGRIDKILGRGWRTGLNKGINDMTGQFGTSVAARGVSAMNELRGEDIKYTEALLREKFLPGEEIDGASEELQQALAKGDVARARAATRILTTAGNPGRSRLRKTVQEFETSHNGTREGREMLRTSLAVVGVRDEVNAANMKANDAVMARWAVSKGGTYVENVKNSTDTYTGLTAMELAGQANDIVEHGAQHNLFSADQAREVLDSQQARSAANQQKIATFERHAGSTVNAPSENRNSTPANENSIPKTSSIPKQKQPQKTPPIDHGGMPFN